ncbi:hypothetical protein CK203_055743 [Vitis vinifera]|uniref:Uncharacterized protein n=1 Tax=Vitis vinifera TaxID=29760 RepID=A0A438H1D3_VITVI|nr:hypothetical protein CK203_055743 [Vitis vinifera]
MARTRGGHTDPSASREAWPSASAPQDPSQASQAPTVPSSEGGGPGETSSQAPADSQAQGDIQRPSGIAPEVIIKRPMVTAPPIPGNSNCRARPFHSKLYFDMEAMRQQTDLQDSFGLLQRIQSSSDSGLPYLSETWSAFYQEGLLEIHACYATLPYIGAYGLPYLAPPRALPPLLSGTLDLWTQLAQQDEHPTESIPSTPTAPFMPRAASTDPPATPPIPPVALPPSQDFSTISGLEFRGMIQQHLGLAPPQTDIPGPLELRALIEETIPTEETITADVPP